VPGSELRSASSKGSHGGSRPLSAREREVLGLLAEGMSGAAIAERLVLSPETVRTHVRNAMDKLGASTRSQAVALALEQGHIGDSAGVTAEPVVAKKPRPRPTDRSLAGDLGELTAGLVTLADIDSAAAYVADESGMVLRLEGEAGSPGHTPESASEVVLGENGIGRVALERRTQLVTAPAGPDAASGPVLATPLVGSGRLVGVLCVGVRPSRPVSRREMLLLEAFAHRVGEVLAADAPPTAQLQRALQRFRASWTGALAA